MTVAIPLYLAGLALLFCVELFGVSAKGAKRGWIWALPASSRPNS